MLQYRSRISCKFKYVESRRYYSIRWFKRSLKTVHVNTYRSAERPVGVPHPRACARRPAARVAAGLTRVGAAARPGRRWPSSARVLTPKHRHTRPNLIFNQFHVLELLLIHQCCGVCILAFLDAYVYCSNKVNILYK